MKEKILETFDFLGFKMEPIENLGYSFDYEGSNYFYMPMDNDEDYVNICIPGVYDVEDGDEMLCYSLMDKVNASMKYVKCYRYGNRVWLFYERELIGGEDLPILLSHMILSLEASLNFLRKSLLALQAEGNGGDDVPAVTSDGESAENGEAEVGGDKESDDEN